jgi:type IV pilus assembly protein PilN
MIKINLLPVKDEKFVRKARGFLLTSLILVSIVVVAVVINSSILQKQENDSKQKIAEADRHIANLKTIIGEIKKLKKKKDALKKKIKMINNLQSKNIGPVRVLDEIALKLPSSKIWLNEISLSNSRLSISGESLDNQEVAKFMKQLESSMFFSNVNLRKVERSKQISGVQILKYSMTTKAYLEGRGKTSSKNSKK